MQVWARDLLRCSSARTRKTWIKLLPKCSVRFPLRARKGFTREEVQNAIAYITGSYAVTLATNSAVAGQLLVGEVFGLGLDYIQKRNSYYQSVTVEQVNEAAKKYLRPGQGTLVVAGTYKGSTGS
jgi:zinc protease